MTSPTVTALGTPTGHPLADGFSTRVVFSANTTIELYIKTITPPGLDGGAGVDQTTMHNTLWKTKAPRSLIEVTDASFKAAYDPNLYTSILALLNSKTGSVTYWFSDGSAIAFWAYLMKFQPAEVSEGTQPEADVSIVHTNWDPVAKVEAGPTVQSTPGT